MSSRSTENGPAFPQPSRVLPRPQEKCRRSSAAPIPGLLLQSSHRRKALSWTKESSLPFLAVLSAAALSAVLMWTRPHGTVRVSREHGRTAHLTQPWRHRARAAQGGHERPEGQSWWEQQHLSTTLVDNTCGGPLVYRCLSLWLSLPFLVFFAAFPCGCRCLPLCFSLPFLVAVAAFPCVFRCLSLYFSLPFLVFFAAFPGVCAAFPCVLRSLPCCFAPPFAPERGSACRGVRGCQASREGYGRAQGRQWARAAGGGGGPRPCRCWTSIRGDDGR